MGTNQASTVNNVVLWNIVKIILSKSQSRKKWNFFGIDAQVTHFGCCQAVTTSYLKTPTNQVLEKKLLPLPTLCWISFLHFHM